MRNPREHVTEFSTRTLQAKQDAPLTLIQNSYHGAQPGCAPGFALLRAGGFAISIIAFLGPRQSGESLVYVFQKWACFCFVGFG